MEHYVISDKTLILLADAIREKSGNNNKLLFPQEFISEIQNLSMGNYDFFEGNYEIIPKIIPQNLETKGKVMKNNINIREIPYYEVSNDSSGNTVYIGGDLNA